MPDISPEIANAFEKTNESSSVLAVCDAFNTRCDSTRISMQVSGSFASIPNTPQYGAGILMVEGKQINQAAGLFIACKNASGAGSVNELMQVAGAGDRLGETYQLQWPAGQSLQIKTSGTTQPCSLKWRS